jgi:hypothetical protein
LDVAAGITPDNTIVEEVTLAGADCPHIPATAVSADCARFDFVNAPTDLLTPGSGRIGVLGLQAVEQLMGDAPRGRPW